MAAFEVGIGAPSLKLGSHSAVPFVNRLAVLVPVSNLIVIHLIQILLMRFLHMWKITLPLLLFLGLGISSLLLQLCMLGSLNFGNQSF